MGQAMPMSFFGSLSWRMNELGLGLDWFESEGVILFLARIDINELLIHLLYLLITIVLYIYQREPKTLTHSLGTKLALISRPKCPSFYSLICKC